MRLKTPAQLQYVGSYQQLRDTVTCMLDHLPSHVSPDEPLRDADKLAGILAAVNEAHQQFEDCHREVSPAGDRLRDVMKRNLEVTG